MCYICYSMLVVTVSEKVSETKRVGKINKKLQEQEASLCAVHKSPLKKDKERLNLVHFRNVEEEFRSQHQIKTSRNS